MMSHAYPPKSKMAESSLICDFFGRFKLQVAGQCRSVQVGAGQCRSVQVGAGQCRLMQVSAG